MSIFIPSIPSLATTRVIAPILELAIWKSKITEQCHDQTTIINLTDDIKLRCRYESVRS
jgi:hypothetical protein